MADLKGPNSRELFRFTMRRVRNFHDAEDLVQDTYLRSKVWLPHPHVEHELKWLYGTAKHAIHDFHHEETYDKLVQRGHELKADEEPIAPDDAERVNAITDLQKLLDGLPPRHMEIIILHKGEGYSYEEVAEMLNLSIHTVEKYVTHSLQQLRGKGTVKEIESRWADKHREERVAAVKLRIEERERATLERRTARLLAAEAKAAARVAARDARRAAKAAEKAARKEARRLALEERRNRPKPAKKADDERYLKLKEKYPTVEFYP